MRIFSKLIPRNTGIPTKLRRLKSTLYCHLSREPLSVGWLIATERKFAPSIEKDAPILSDHDGRQEDIEQGGDKMGFERHAYAPFYQEHLKRFIGKPITLVELGVFRGSGLAVFAEIFPPPSLLIGLDIEPARYNGHKDNLIRRGAFKHGAPAVYKFDAYAPDISVLERALGGRSIDIFIDDGPHATDSINIVAEVVKPCLSGRYLYVAEDNPEVAGLLEQTLGASEVGRYRGLSYATS
jgi:hypothetical protein